MKRIPKARSGIQIEPHGTFKNSIVGLNKKGQYIYDYDKLVQACMDLYGFEVDDAVEWVDYNIVGLEPNGMEVRAKG